MSLCCISKLPFIASNSTLASLNIIKKSIVDIFCLVKQDSIKCKVSYQFQMHVAMSSRSYAERNQNV